MVAEHADRKINTDEKVKNDGVRRLPHERDEAPDAQHPKTRGVIKQAASDLEQGLVDTDRYAQPGAEKVKPAQPRQAKPDADTDSKSD